MLEVVGIQNFWENSATYGWRLGEQLLGRIDRIVHSERILIPTHNEGITPSLDAKFAPRRLPGVISQNFCRIIQNPSCSVSHSAANCAFSLPNVPPNATHPQHAIYWPRTLRSFCCVKSNPYLFFNVTRCLEYLSSGENLAGCADLVTSPETTFFRV